jgi:hypothetical protein
MFAVRDMHSVLAEQLAQGMTKCALTAAKVSTKHGRYLTLLVRLLHKARHPAHRVVEIFLVTTAQDRANVIT